MRMVSLFQKRELVSHLKLCVRQKRSVSYIPNHSQMMMNSNTTCVPGNSTSCPTTVSDGGSNTGLIVGLSVFFIVLTLLTIVAGFLAYRKFGQLRRVLSFGSRKRIEKEREEVVQGEAPKTVKESHRYESRQEAMPAQAPIYENVARVPSYGAKAHDRTAHVPEDDVYLQCDAIYSNDPACNPSADHQEDDTYIMPES